MTGPSTTMLSECAKRIESSLDDVFASAARIRDAAISTWPSLVDDDGRVASSQLKALKPAIFGELDTHPYYTGCGFIPAPNVLTDVDRYLEWWQPGVTAEHEPLLLDVDLSSPEVYDYTTMSWYLGAKAGLRSVHGPYLDYAGADSFVLTFAIPTVVDGTFVGVAGVDIAMAVFDPILYAHVKAEPTHLAIVNRDNRVLVSNSPEFAPSERIRSVTSEGIPIGGEGVAWRLCPLG